MWPLFSRMAACTSESWVNPACRIAAIRSWWVIFSRAVTSSSTIPLWTRICGFPSRIRAAVLFLKVRVVEQRVRPHQRQHEDEASRDGVVACVHAVLDRVGQDEQQHEIQGGQLPHLALACEPQDQEQEPIDQQRPHDELPPGLRGPPETHPHGQGTIQQCHRPCTHSDLPAPSPHRWGPGFLHGLPVPVLRGRDAAWDEFLLREPEIVDHQRAHGLGHRHDPGGDARVVAALDDDLGRPRRPGRWSAGAGRWRRWASPPGAPPRGSAGDAAQDPAGIVLERALRPRGDRCSRSLGRRAAANPAPISTPLTAPMLMQA